MSASAQETISAPAGDFVLPFDIAKAGVRGRFVRLDAASARALEAHKLPEAAARVVRLYTDWGQSKKAEEWRQKLGPEGRPPGPTPR